MVSRYDSRIRMNPRGKDHVETAMFVRASSHILDAMMLVVE